ncbi:hypothetical protein PPTG_24571 [Phytophthora nicotianae INRA-310]|uniref:Uncharacterized protein n=1 Tax=Phytophthora nicotianae (strain INRA-310) TaxID=761204 RepID=W2PF60_PHYN3|nr:hypothetical protein PPTG_24571 [Phytophthora nicotianae INRA-310]ETM98649.1 hypothetical protein PPTG_24571 [Phytophthora nicotianae INRA-310]
MPHTPRRKSKSSCSTTLWKVPSLNSHRTQTNSEDGRKLQRAKMPSSSFKKRQNSEPLLQRTGRAPSSSLNLAPSLNR